MATACTTETFAAVLTSWRQLRRALRAPWWGQLTMWLCLASGATAAPQKDQVVLWTGSMTPPRAAYESEVIKLALEKSREKYGNYAFEASAKLLSTERLERAIREGELVNVASSPIWEANRPERSPLTIIPIPIAKGLLGYRQLIVRRDDLPRFEKLSTLESLRALTAGLGSNWTELDVFRDSQLTWYSGKDIPQLFTMLSRGRLDYVPLGVMEAQEVLDTSPHKDQLAIVPGLILYYPLPIFIQVSVGQPRVAERLEYGLRLAKADGSLEQLFNQYYGGLAKKLRSQPARVIVLPNPNLPEFVEEQSPVLLRR